MTVRTLLDAEAIAAHVRRIGGEIAADHPDGVVLVGVLKGALLFLADLVRAVPDVPVEIDFLAISRYAPDSGRVRLLQDVGSDLSGRDVVLVEDIVDTGLTCAYLTEHLVGHGARRVRVAALLDRRPRRIVPIEVHHRGVEIDDVFVLGYGLHYRDLYRNLGKVVAVDRDALVSDPEAFVADCYGS